MAAKQTRLRYSEDVTNCDSKNYPQKYQGLFKLCMITK